MDVADSSVSLHPQLGGDNEGNGDCRGNKTREAEEEDGDCLPPLVASTPHTGGTEECQHSPQEDEGRHHVPSPM